MRGAAHRDRTKSSLDIVTGLPVKAMTRIAGAAFMRGVAHRKLCGDGEGLDICAMLGESGGECCFIERVFLVAIVIVAAAHHRERHAGKGASMPDRRDHLRSKPMRMTPTRPPWPSTTALVASVVDTETSEIAASRAGPRQARHRRDGLGDPDGEIASGGDGLGRSDDRWSLAAITAASV